MPVVKADIKGFFGYAISRDGRVWSRWTNHGLRDKWKQLRYSTARGYLQVSLSKGGKQYYRKVHHLVLEAFIGPRLEGMQGCHNDGNRLNNDASNLRWDTASSNYQDRHRHGTSNNGVRNGRAKLTDAQVVEIRSRLANGEKQVPLSDEFGVSQVAISQIKLGKHWTHLGGI